MADKKHLELLEKGVKKWNAWRVKNPSIEPDLTAASFSGVGHYDNIDLSNTDLSKAFFLECTVKNGNFSSATLDKATLSYAYFNGCNFSNASLRETKLRKTNLSHCQLTASKIIGCEASLARFVNATMANAYISDCDLGQAKFDKADLSDAEINNTNLDGAWFYEAILDGININRSVCYYTLFAHSSLKQAKLDRVYFTRNNFYNADLSGATIENLTFSDFDFRDVKGLEAITHKGPSTIGIDSLYRSYGKIPPAFLKNSGVPDEMITYAPSLIEAQGSPLQFLSCFISYSFADEAFAQKLYSRLRDEKLRVWFAPEDMKAGKKIYEQIDNAIHVFDRLLIILSGNSIKSEWVFTEIKKASKQEKREGKRKIFPIRLVDYEVLKNWELVDADLGKDLAQEIRSYYIPDFSDWENHDAFEAGIKRLLQDLKAE